ncbi:MAG: beta-propeller fold lactonase family protein [Candidatus Sulfotelmatobacter sp.]
METASHSLSKTITVPINFKILPHTVALAFAVAAAIGIASAPLSAQDTGFINERTGSVYTETNATANSILVFNRAVNGSLSLAATVPTGGKGGGVVSVGSQGALALSQDGRWLFAANEGDSTISVLRRNHEGLTAVGKVSSNGTLPVSITVSRNLVYVLNDGSQASNSPANITGFYFDDFRGALFPIPLSTRSLSAPFPTVPAAGPDAAEIGFDNTGRFLYVTEVGTSEIDKYSINFDGTPGQDEEQTSFGNSPFAFAFDPRDNLLVTEVHESAGIVGQGAASSYQLNYNGDIDVISRSVPDSQSAPCWLALTGDGRYAYTVNTASSNISGYEVGRNGELSLLGNGVTAKTGPAPLDIAFTRDSRYLYNVSGGGALIGFQVQSDGSLTPLTQVTAVPTTSRGLVAR